MSLIGRAERGDPGLYCVVCCACDWRGPHGQTHAEADDTATRHAATHRGAVEAAREQIKALIMAQSAAGYVETAGWALLLDEIDKLPTPGGSSPMSLIERWTIWKTALDDDGRHDAYIAGPDAGDWAGDGVEVVPASQLEGAVEALREFQDAYVREFGMGRGSDFVVRHVETIVAKLSRGTE
jgi:hypothetical protein